MELAPRALAARIRDLQARFPAILVTGPRQSGKTTLLKSLLAESFADADRRLVAFDTPADVDRFRRDPALFFAEHDGVLCLDEVQHVPDILPWVKKLVDQDPRRFRFFLSGSQHFPLMKGVTESLAGRVAVLDLWPFAACEFRGGDAARVLDLLERPDALLGLPQPAAVKDGEDVLPAMLAGGYPAVLLRGAGTDWFESYRRTFIQRDVRDLSQVGDLGRFDRFVTLVAGRTGTVLNKAVLANDLGVDNKTVDHWLSLLVTSFQLVSLAPWSEDATRRVVKRPRWHFADSGMALHLQAVRDPQALLSAPHFDRLFESFVVMELRKLHGHAGRPWNGHFFATPRGATCHVVLPAAGRLVPIEIQHTASPKDHPGLDAFLAEYDDRAPLGLLVSLKPEVERVSERVINVPLGLVMNGAAML